MSQNKHSANHEFVDWFRRSTPYIHAFRDRVFVLCFGGEMLIDGQFTTLAHDIALLNSLGVRLVLVHGARPQINARLQQKNIHSEYVDGLRITDSDTLPTVIEAIGSIRVEIETQLSTGLANSPMHGAAIRVVSGNNITAQPLGIRDGVDFAHTGEVRRIDTEAIKRHLTENTIVLLSPLGYSPTGEVFNLGAEDVATAAAIQLHAEKLVHMIDTDGIIDHNDQLQRELTLAQAEDILLSKNTKLDAVVKHSLQSAMTACNDGVKRAHLINRFTNGAIIHELFTRDGIGTLVTSELFEGTRQAKLDDIGGIIEIITPLEHQGILLRRSREQLELEIENFYIVERDGMVVACAALFPYLQENTAELACLAVHPEYQNQQRGEHLLVYIERKLRQLNINQLFVLTTRTSHWFREKSFSECDINSIPISKRKLYNYSRNSKVYIKNI